MDQLVEEPKPATAGKPARPAQDRDKTERLERPPGEERGEYAVAGYKCPNCKASLEVGAQFCVECGTNLATGGKMDAAKADDIKSKKKLDRKTMMLIGGAIAGLIVIGALTFFLPKLFAKKKSSPPPTAPPAQQTPAPEPGPAPRGDAPSNEAPGPTPPPSAAPE